MAHTFNAFIGFYPTRDLAATRAFYGGVLGLPLVRDQSTCHIYGVAGGGYLGFCQSESPVEYDRRVILTLVTDEVDRVYEALRAAGVPCEAAPSHNSQYAIYHFYAAGPNGERVEVQRFAQPLE